MSVETAALGRLPTMTTPAKEPGPERTSAEQILVARARGGDAAAFRSLFERHAPPVRRFLRDLLRDGESADEATQETFVRAHRQLPTMRDDQRLGPWLFGIARNVFYEELRARRHRGRELVDDGDGQHALAAIDPSMPPVPTPEAALMGREADAELARALAGLDEERRAALLLRIDHGLDYEEIRQVMGWTLPKVKNEIHRARLELRQRLAKYVGGR